MTGPLILLFEPRPPSTALPLWRWPLEVAAALVMPWRAAARIRSLNRCLEFMTEVIVSQHAKLSPDKSAEAAAPAAPVLRLIRGGVDGR